MPPAMIDSDTLSELIKGYNPATRLAAAEYLVEHGSLSFSLITRYEVLRGLKAKNAMAQLAAFETRCASSVVLPLSDGVIQRAADLYAHLKWRGELLPNADLLIAATAMEHGLVLITNNTRHFSQDSWPASRLLEID